MTKNNEKIRVEKYLERFDEILWTMKNKMLCVRIQENITKYFIECMIPHHQAAIFMCENLLQYTNFLPLIKICNNIIKTQTEGIKQMRDIYSTTKGYDNSIQDIKLYFEKYYEIVRVMVQGMKNSSRSMNINFDFITQMIPHHEGAISMCENLLEYNIDPRLRLVAIDIIEEQRHGIDEMETLLKFFEK